MLTPGMASRAHTKSLIAAPAPMAGPSAGPIPARNARGPEWISALLHGETRDEGERWCCVCAALARRRLSVGQLPPAACRNHPVESSDDS